MEQDAGVSLFDRAGRRLSLTEAGQKLVATAERVEAIFIRDVMGLSSNSKDICGPVRMSIGSPTVRLIIWRCDTCSFSSAPTPIPSGSLAAFKRTAKVSSPLEPAEDRWRRASPASSRLGTYALAQRNELLPPSEKAQPWWPKFTNALPKTERWYLGRGRFHGTASQGSVAGNETY